jgi:hypothetical protein
MTSGGMPLIPSVVTWTDSNKLRETRTVPIQLPHSVPQINILSHVSHSASLWDICLLARTS